jgi:glycosyltransferase involved in cell wall biosynthesis
MKISIITPTHNPKFLPELEKSILSQTYPDWEWIILVNGTGKQALYNDFYNFTDSRIKVVISPFDSGSVGLLKKYTSLQATGDIILEADHDDILTPDCLEEVNKAFQNNETGFVYSDNAKLGNFKSYNSSYGWIHKSFDYNGETLPVMTGQPLTPGRMGYIWFAPDHVRAWRKSIYDSIGGHNETLTVCDDLDLIHRLYMVTKFHYIPKVLYIYRITGDNTWLRKNEFIQSETVRIYNKDIYNLSARFADINNLLKIDLCGGFNKPNGYISIDKHNSDITYDLNGGIPLKENSVGVVRAFDALEHLKDQQLIMREIHRVLAPGGILLSQTPSTDGRGAWQDPTHVSFWNQNSFWYWTRKEQAQYIRNDKMFRECYLNTEFPNDHCKQNNIPYVVAHLEKI